MFATSRFIFLVFMLSELVLRTVRNWKDPLGLLAFDSPRGFCSWPPSCFSLCFEYSVFRNSKVNHVNGWNSSQNVCARREVPRNNWIYPQCFRISSLDVLEMQKCVWFLIWGLVTHECGWIILELEHLCYERIFQGTLSVISWINNILGRVVRWDVTRKGKLILKYPFIPISVISVWKSMLKCAHLKADREQLM